MPKGKFEHWSIPLCACGERRIKKGATECFRCRRKNKRPPPQRKVAHIIACACGCGHTRLSRDRNGREHRYLKGHRVSNNPRMRDYEAIAFRADCGETYQSIADDLGVTRQRIEQIYRKVHGMGKLANKQPTTKTRPICQMCPNELPKYRARYCSDDCRRKALNVRQKIKKRERYHSDPAVRQYQTDWQRAHREQQRGYEAKSREKKRRELSIPPTPIDGSALYEASTEEVWMVDTARAQA